MKKCPKRTQNGIFDMFFQKFAAHNIFSKLCLYRVLRALGKTIPLSFKKFDEKPPRENPRSASVLRCLFEILRENFLGNIGILTYPKIHMQKSLHGRLKVSSKFFQ